LDPALNKTQNPAGVDSATPDPWPRPVSTPQKARNVLIRTSRAWTDLGQRARTWRRCLRPTAHSICRSSSRTSGGTAGSGRDAACFACRLETDSTLLLRHACAH